MVSTDVTAVRAVRGLLRDAGYTAEAIGGRLHIPGELRIATGDKARARFLLDDSRPLDVLVRLFLLGDAVEANTAGRALEDGLELLFRTGLVEVDDGKVRATVLLVPHGDLIVASDPLGKGDRRWVPGVQRPSDLLACLTPRARVGRALDLGTGNAIQALLLSDHAEHVVAVDVNDHALELARLNAVLNGRDDSIDFRQGSFLEPVAGELFDLIVSNPPYVVSPENSYVFRDADVRGDVMCRSLIVDIVEHLTAGGLAVVMVSWVQHGEDPPPPQQWLEDAGADGVVMTLAVHEALDAAMLWNTPHLADAEEFARRVEEWSGYFAAEDIPAIGHGVVALRRAPAGCSPLTVALPATAPPGRRGGAQLERVVRSIGREERGGGPSILALAPDAQLIEISRVTPTGLAVAATDLSVPEGLAFSVGLDPSGAQLVRQFADPTSIEEAVASFAGLGPDEREHASAFLGRLVHLGLLVTVDQ